MADLEEASTRKAQQKEKKKKGSSKSESNKIFLETEKPQIGTDDEKDIFVNLLEAERSLSAKAKEEADNIQNKRIKKGKKEEKNRETIAMVGQEFIVSEIMPVNCDLNITTPTEMTTIPEISVVPKITTLEEVHAISEITTDPEVFKDLGYEEGVLEEPSAPSPRTRSPSSPYIIPPPTTTHIDLLLEIDEDKLIELKEAFELFDMNSDGYIDHKDLKGTLISLGQDVKDEEVKNMLSEATYPLDFDAFVMLLGYKSMELDSEETLVEALAQWDHERTGFISEQRIRHDLMTWGDRFTEREVDMAFDEAPVVQRKGRNMIDYIKFCKILCGLRKARKVVQN